MTALLSKFHDNIYTHHVINIHWQHKNGIHWQVWLCNVVAVFVNVLYVTFSELLSPGGVADLSLYH